MVIVGTIAVTWCVVLVAVISWCRMAAYGDRTVADPAQAPARAPEPAHELGGMSGAEPELVPWEMRVADEPAAAPQAPLARAARRRALHR